MLFNNPVLIILLTGLIVESTASLCTVEKLPAPQVFGIEVLDVFAKEVKGHDRYTAYGTLPPLVIDPRPLDFCNVTIRYTHPGLNDTIHTHIWLPLSGWNGNFLAQGGGGWAAGILDALPAPVNQGYASAVTDGGHSIFGDDIDVGLGSKTWSLVSPGNVNLVLLQDFAYRAIDEMTHISKHIVRNFYGRDARYSYWHGCSTGGRQGMVQAQRYPANYDGILTACPAINWASFLITEFWAHVVMKKLNYYPPACELDAITTAAVEACDELDGVKDGVVSAPGHCQFDAEAVVGKKFDCNGGERTITKEAAEIANEMWHGPLQDGIPTWFGLTHETALAGYPPVMSGLAMTTCDADNRGCKSKPFEICADWIRQFIAKDSQYDPTTMTEDEFFDALRKSRQQYASFLDTADPDLRAFKAAGGKMIHWHGLADNLIFPNGSSNYYERVQQIVPDLESFYRYFEAPGVAHCLGGPGAFPSHALEALVDWVEKGIAPERLEATTVSQRPGETVKTRPLCRYPLVAAYKGGDPDVASSFECSNSFGKVNTQHHNEL